MSVALSEFTEEEIPYLHRLAHEHPLGSVFLRPSVQITDVVHGDDGNVDSKYWIAPSFFSLGNLDAETAAGHKEAEKPAGWDDKYILEKQSVFATDAERKAAALATATAVFAKWRQSLIDDGNAQFAVITGDPEVDTTLLLDGFFQATFGAGQN